MQYYSLEPATSFNNTKAIKTDHKDDVAKSYNYNEGHHKFI